MSRGPSTRTRQRRTPGEATAVGEAVAATDAAPPTDVVRDGFVLDFISDAKQVKETPKELVRQRIARALFHEYGISVEDMAADFPVSVGGRRRRVDIAGGAVWSAMPSPASAGGRSPRSPAPTCWRSSLRSGTSRGKPRGPCASASGRCWSGPSRWTCERTTLVTASCRCSVRRMTSWSTGWRCLTRTLPRPSRRCGRRGPRARRQAGVRVPRADGRPVGGSPTRDMGRGRHGRSRSSGRQATDPGRSHPPSGDDDASGSPRERPAAARVILGYNSGVAHAYHQPAQGRRLRHAGGAPGASRSAEAPGRRQGGYRHRGRPLDCRAEDTPELLAR